MHTYVQRYLCACGCPLHAPGLTHLPLACPLPAHYLPFVCPFPVPCLPLACPLHVPLLVHYLPLACPLAYLLSVP